MTEPTLEHFEGWGMAPHARSLVYRPRHPGEAAEALADARHRGLSVVHRGGGLSYGDAALNQGGATVLTTGMDRIFGVDEDEGLVRAEAGVTFEALWQHLLPLGWWPPVVPGTMKVTLGGAVAMNVHGKNHFVAGAMGDHVEALTVLRADGTVEPLLARRDGEKLRAVIGAQGLNGTILEVTLRLKKIHSGYLEVLSRSTGSLGGTLDCMESRSGDHDYAVAWIDAFPRRRAGRGVAHFARYLDPDHTRAGQALTLEAQHLPSRILGVLPRSEAWRALAPLTHDPGMRLVNAGRFWSAIPRHRQRYVQSHAGFHFLLDYMPGWKRVYRPHGFIQYQLFVAKDAARHAFGEALRLQRRAGVYSYLGVIKRHRADPSAAGYALDGYSLALDLPIRPGKLAEFRSLCRSYDDLLEEVGGRIYAAKDFVGVGRLPAERDPLFSSNLVRRWERGAGA